MRRLILCLLAFSKICNAQLELPLYAGRIPNAVAGSNKEQKVFNAVVDTLTYNVSRPTISVFLAPANNNKRIAVIIFPGGGYQALLTKREGSDPARVFNAAGITAFVVKYRLPNDSIMRDKATGPLQDAQQAIKLVRENAQRWNIDPQKIGIMGYSAGGHLASTAATHFADSIIENRLKTSLRPDFAILVNPVISFSHTLGHKGSARALLGESPSAERIRFFSSEEQVGDSTPPCILVHSNEDSVVSVDNSLAFYYALRKHNISAEIHIYSKGEHGFLTAPSFDEWFGRCLRWVEQTNMKPSNL